MAGENDDTIGGDLQTAITELTQSGEQHGQEDSQKSGGEVATFDGATGKEITTDKGGGASGEVARDESGRFAPRTPAQQIPADQKSTEVAATKPGQPAPAQQQTAQQQLPASRAPISWKPATREMWNKLPVEVQAEVIRREREVDNALRTSADSRKFMEGFQQMVAPFEMHFRAEGVNAMQAVDHMLQLGAQMRAGSPTTKANIIATLVRQHGVDINLLDQVLTAQLRGGPAPQDNPILQQLDQRLKPLTDFMAQMQGMQQQSQQRTTQQAEQTLEEFLADPANEFVADVADDMADLLDMASRRGQKMSLQDAYSRATLLHPEIAAILAQRQLTQQATQQTEAARKAQQASASPASAGAPSQGGGNEESDDIRSAVVASVNQLSRR
jgi:hypothetical protein